MKKTLIALMMTALVSSCATNTKRPEEKNSREYQIGAYLWFQRSAEYKALMYQAYNNAQDIVEKDLKVKRKKKRAVIFDIDETVLDNSYAGASEIKKNTKWHNGLFEEWVKVKKATALPGAIDFVKYLKAKNIEPIFISNRKDAWKEDTYANMLMAGFDVKKEDVILMDKEKSKESRRQEIAKNFEIILLVGDNLLDLDKEFDHAGMDERNNLVDQKRQLFGRRYIVLPNPMYGDWENTLPKVLNKKELLKVNP